MRTLALAAAGLVLALSAPARADPPAPAPEGPGPLLGCWKFDGETPAFVAFENERVRLLVKDHLQHYYARYDKGRVVLWAWVNKDVWKTAVKGDVLTVDLESGPVVYRRVAKEPDGLAVRPLALGVPAPLPPERVTALQADLARRRVEDQAVRKDPKRAADMPKVDADDTAFVEKTVAEVGWIDATRFGREAADAAFLLVQHSGHMPLMLACLPEIEKGVQAKSVDPQNFALLHDRLALNLGRKQRYGTQLGQGPDKKLVVMPIEDRANVETTRAALGLFPLSQYLGYFKAGNGGKLPEFLEWE